MRDLIRPCSGTYGTGYKAVQPLLVKHASLKHATNSPLQRHAPVTGGSSRLSGAFLAQRVLAWRIPKSTRDGEIRPEVSRRSFGLEGGVVHLHHLRVNPSPSKGGPNLYGQMPWVQKLGPKGRCRSGASTFRIKVFGPRLRAETKDQMRRETWRDGPGSGRCSLESSLQISM